MNLVLRKTNSLVRMMLTRCPVWLMTPYVVNEYPKSGGTWLGQMLSAALDLPFPRNRFPVWRSSIFHGHYLHPWGMQKVVVLWRDGRDVMVSFYHHCLFKNELHNDTLIEIVRRAMPFQDYENVSKNLPVFLDYCFTQSRHPRFSWADFVRRWHGRPGVVYARYEQLYTDTAKELQRLVLELTGQPLDLEKAASIAENFSFSRLSGRRPAEENKGSFMRKGIIGDWHNHFTQEARVAFDHYAGDELLLLGYEQNRAWVQDGLESAKAGS